MASFLTAKGVLVRYVGIASNVAVPENITQIGDYAFDGCDNVKKIILPKGVEKIGERAFSCCSYLKEVVMCEGVTKIGAFAFTYCTKLSSAKVPKSVETIETHAFYCCKSLKELTLSNGVKEIGDNAFSRCDGIKELFIPESVTKIGENICSCKIVVSENSPVYASSGGVLYDKDMKTVIFCPSSAAAGYVFPKTVTKIADNAFRDCAIEEIFIPENISAIGNGAFAGCTKLRKATVSDGVSEIGSHAFEDCSELEFISLPESLKKLGENAFLWCEKVSCEFRGTVYAPSEIYKLYRLINSENA